MKILIAEDDPVARCILETTLRKSGYEVLAVLDGKAAWQALQQPEAPRLAILDWMMPGNGWSRKSAAVCEQALRNPTFTS